MYAHATFFNFINLFISFCYNTGKHFFLNVENEWMNE